MEKFDHLPLIQYFRIHFYEMGYDVTNPEKTIISFIFLQSCFSCQDLLIDNHSWSFSLKMQNTYN